MSGQIKGLGSVDKTYDGKCFSKNSIQTIFSPQNNPEDKNINNNISFSKTNIFSDCFFFFF